MEFEDEFPSTPRETLLREIEATEIQIDRMNAAIAVAEENRDEMDSRAYEATVSGYRSQREDLELDLIDYQNRLRAISSAK